MALLAPGLTAGCRQVQLAGHDRAALALGGGADAAPHARVDVDPDGTERTLARPSVAVPQSPAAPVAGRIVMTAPAVCGVYTRDLGVTDGDSPRSDERLLLFDVLQGDSRSAVRESFIHRMMVRTGEVEERHGDPVRFSRWRSRVTAPSPHGIVLRLHGLDESPIDRRLDQQLLARGWMIVQFDSIELGSIGFARTPAGRTVRTVDSPREAGHLVDVIVAQVASAAEHVVMAERARLIGEGADPDLPVLVVGTSLGGILAPAAAAMLDATLVDTGSGLSGLVLLAAGGDLGGISASSPAMDPGPDIVPPVELLAWRRLMRQAIEFSQLDPLIVAPALRHVPTLMLHGRFDEIVPARFGEQLWQALGRPDRYSYLAGHYGLLGLLTGEADAVIRWLDRHVPPASGAD